MWGLKNQEEHYRLSGWQNDEHQQLQSQISTKRLSKQLSTIHKRITPSVSKASRKQQCKNSIKYCQQTESIDISELKKQDQRQDKSCFKLRQSYQYQNQIQNVPHLQTLKQQPKRKHKHLKSTQALYTTPSLQSQDNYLSKYTLFSNIKHDRRNKIHLDFQRQQEKNMRRIIYQSEKRFLIPKRANLQRLFRGKQQKKIKKQVSQHRMKLPLFFAKLQKQKGNFQKPKSHNYTLNLDQKNNQKCLFSYIENTLC